MSMRLESSAFAADQRIPVKYTADGQNVSPPLTWSQVPEGTRELALIVDDPDAPRAEPWVHWVIYQIPSQAPGLPEGVSHDASPKAPAGAAQGKNSWGTIGYRGPEPPRGHGIHHYRFHLYALDAKLQLHSGLDKQALLSATAGHVLGESELIGTYER